MVVSLVIDVLAATQTVQGSFASLRNTLDETWIILRKAVE
jgi:hypothetical protein